ncbi:alkaline phosphatase family protein [Rhizosphaericola mali]|uniref:Alkaline phosphatase family protein n=1 Tax=Rhizosphaericola mali TaxID=2545455 RepID=A0A5P2G340_9BACT|nr:ectonucleotide pyrophosphatase/phosphodiesterase [Rhizosphaericola mali]QES89905.1 alkaline phosphatase family protein [Rhizosphaericola mali]
MHYKSILNFFLLFIGIYTGARAQDTTQKITLNRINATTQEQKPYVILISIDGFRYDYRKIYHANHLNKLAENGVAAQSMYPSFPSITFPNHYTIVSGLYPAHHGLIGNDIYDSATNSRYSLGNAKAVKNPYWYGGTPLWVLAEKQQMLSASFYWPGSEAPIQNTLPTYYYAYNEKIPIASRIQTVVNWLELPAEKRPHFITFYFPQVDHAGHKFGPKSKETKSAVAFVDSSINALNDAVQKTGLPVNFIVVSDHGMTQLKENNPLHLPFQVDSTSETIVSNGSLVDIFVPNPTKRDSLYKELQLKKKHFEVYYKNELPEDYHYRTSDDRYHRIGDIVLVAHAPFYFSNHKKTIAGSHGFYVKETPDMQATFLAWGPAFKSGITIPSFTNIEIFPLIADILGLKYDPNSIDGKDILAKEILK